MKRVNIELFHLINQFAGKSQVFDKVMIFTAQFLFFFFLLYLIYIWFRRDKTKPIALFGIYSATLGILMNFILSLFYYHPRPFVSHLGKLLINHKPDSSFPSDHTTLMLSIAFILIYFRETRIMGIILSVAGLFGGISRVYCGLHFPFDIAGSIVVGVISSLTIFLFRNKLKRWNRFIMNIYDFIIRKI